MIRPTAQRVDEVDRDMATELLEASCVTQGVTPLTLSA
jgi:hypothetical protein